MVEIFVVPNIKMNINSLPSEILTRIFLYLPLKDRKNIRLACALWYHCCTRLSIVKNEKLVFRSGYSIQEITKLLTSRHYVNFNLEFQGMPVDTFPTVIWKNCGDKIISLDFHECKLSDKTIKNIIILCTNLKHFKFQTSYCAIDGHIEHVFCSPKTLDELISNKIVRKSLVTFELFVDDPHLPSNIFRKIFQIYPCVKNFSTGCLSFDDMYFICTFLHVGHIGRASLFSRIDKCLTMNNIKKLTFNFPTNGRWMKMLTSSAFKLKELETIIILSEKMIESVFTFFNQQEELEVLKMSLVEAKENSIKKLLFHILKMCGNLRDLRLNFKPTGLSLSDVELKKMLLLTTKLECLSLNFNVLHNARTSISFPDSLINENLGTLRLESNSVDENTCILIMNHCRQLKHLELCNVTDRVLQEIFKFRIGLKTLILNEIDQCSDFGFTGLSEKTSDNSVSSGYSIARLQELEHLEIQGFCFEDLTESVFYEFTFPCLKYLRLAVVLYSHTSRNKIAENPFVYITKNAPLLEVVIFDEIKLSCHTVLEFCKHSKNLYRLNYHNIPCPLWKYVDRFFEVCPTLRFISDSDSNNIYCYNPFTEKILIKFCNDFKFKENVLTGDIDILFLIYY